MPYITKQSEPPPAIDSLSKLVPVPLVLNNSTQPLGAPTAVAELEAIISILLFILQLIPLKLPVPEYNYDISISAFDSPVIFAESMKAFVKVLVIFDPDKEFI